MKSSMMRMVAVAALLVGVAARGAAGQVKEADAAKPAEVPVKAVVLFSSGVGYFEHVGMVKGDSTTELRFKTNQINDILKSLVLQDMGDGKVSSVVYPSQEPLARTLGSFQVDITSNPTLAQMFQQLRGAKVKVTAGTENLSGTILGVEKKPKAVEKGQIEVWVINLISGATIRTVQLDEITKLELEDAVLQEELTKALAAVAMARGQDKKPVTISFKGQGERLVRVGYVVETPIWKTSYRLLMSPKGDNKHAIQGWAIVENQTDNDWKDVQLNLVSGRPISFIQELYQPLYIPRPLVRPDLYASLRPQTYEGGMEMAKKEAVAAGGDRLEDADLASDAKKRPGESNGRTGRGGGGGGGGGLFGAGGEGRADKNFGTTFGGGVELKPLDPAASVASVASASKIGELFEYSVGNVSLPRQRSAMIPIITDPIEVEKLSIYNASVLEKHPLNGARVKNTTKKHLLAGPITVLEGGAYAGDARIDDVPPGQERLLSYGIDLQMRMRVEGGNRSTIQAVKIVKGVMNIQMKEVSEAKYFAENKDAEKDRVLIIEHPVSEGFKLVMAEKPMETTEAVYRFKKTAPASKSVELAVKEEMVVFSEVALIKADDNVLSQFVINDEISKTVKDAIRPAIVLRQQIADAQRLGAQYSSEINQISQEQVRLRENIKTVPEKSTLQNRYLAKLEEQETRIDKLYSQVQEAVKIGEKLRKELEDYLNGLNIE